MRFRQLIQLLNLSLFLLSLAGVIFFFPSPRSFNFFLTLDPVLMLITFLSSRTFSLMFLPAVIVLLAVPFFGRLFCGYICPMGTTIDYSDRLLHNISSKKRYSKSFSRIKYYVLAFLIGASFLEISLVFLGSPISLITRFYGLLVYPIISLMGDAGLRIMGPLAEHFNINSLVFAELKVARFATNLFILVLFVVIFGLIVLSPRFWCRNICPAGALMALISKKPLFRRHVSEDCTNCGKCVKECPMSAIGQESPYITSHEECIVCHKCESVCPVDAISFSAKTEESLEPKPNYSPTRRGFIFAGLTGFGTAMLNYTGLNSIYGKASVGQVLPAGLIRPPGAVPEKEFLSRCVRCGECMVACPTNALQPDWISSGLWGLFSPVLVPRRGACSPECNNCGRVCPTGAVRDVPVKERIWAKMGTAVISRAKCLAWEQQKKCMVCDEVCPFGAVKFRYELGNPVPVPEVHEERCTGCGHCEHHCPVNNEAAIRVSPMGALRLSKGSFKEQGENEGLQISLKHESVTDQSIIEERIAPGFEE